MNAVCPVNILEPYTRCNGACSVSSQDLPGMSEEEQALLTQLATKKKAAEQVYRALQRAEQAATAAATASGTFYPLAPLPSDCC